MKSPKPEKANPNQPKTSTAALEEQRLADFLVRHLLIDKDEAHLTSPKEGDPPGPAHLLQRLRLRGLITTNQAQRLLASLDDVLGQGIPGYELLERIGQGSTSLVFKARQTGADRMVALKIMPNRAARHASESDMFLALAKSWAKLRHPRLLQVLDAGSIPFPYCALEYLPVPSMDRDPRVVKRSKPMSEAELARIAIQTAEALAYLHKKGIIHRDIKPANLFMLEDGSILVGDLGLAIWGKTDPHRASEQRLALGTPYYMPPEQITNDPPLDGRADLYALGITLYQFAAGKVPYPGDNPDQVHSQHLEAPVPQIATVRPELSQAFSQAVAKLMAKEVANRPANAEAVIAAFTRIEAKLIVGF